jgi:hypothetical protein
MTFFGADLFAVIAATISAVATAVLAGFAIVTAKYARKAFEKQSQEVSDQADMLDLQRRQLAEQEKTSAKQAVVLELQATELRESLEQRRRDMDERRRSQAVRVFVGAPPGLTNDMEMFARNASEFPVYDVRIWYLQSDGLGVGEKLGTIMPGAQKQARKRGRLDAVAKAVLTFRDAAGVRWIRLPDGAVSEQEPGASLGHSILASAARHRENNTPSTP